MSRRHPDRWWVYDRPLWRDRMFLLAVAVGLANVVVVVVDRDRYGAGALVPTVLLSVPPCVIWIGLVRELIRRRRGRRGRP